MTTDKYFSWSYNVNALTVQDERWLMDCMRLFCQKMNYPVVLTRRDTTVPVDKWHRMTITCKTRTEYEILSSYYYSLEPLYELLKGKEDHAS